MNRLLLLVIIGFGFAQCKQPAVVSDPVSFDYGKSATKIMTELKPQIVGTWTFQHVQIKPRDYAYALHGVNLSVDTTKQDFATVTIQPALVLHDTPDDPRTPQFEGTIQFQGKTYPVYLKTMANPERVVKGTGFAAIVRLDFNFPNGFSSSDPELFFLLHAGLTDVFSLEIGVNQETMIWKGYNPGISRIDLRKK